MAPTARSAPARIPRRPDRPLRAAPWVPISPQRGSPELLGAVPAFGSERDRLGDLETGRGTGPDHQPGPLEIEDVVGDHPAAVAPARIRLTGVVQPDLDVDSPEEGQQQFALFAFVSHAPILPRGLIPCPAV